MKRFMFISQILLLFNLAGVYADDGYRLWPKYDLISDQNLLNNYKNKIQSLVIEGDSETMKIAFSELEKRLTGLLGKSITPADKVIDDGAVIIGASAKINIQDNIRIRDKPKTAGDEGFIIASEELNSKDAIIITAIEDIGVLYGVFHFLRLLQTNQDISSLDIVSSPKTKLRMLNHWDMYDRSHEYKVLPSIWDWHTLPVYKKQRYIDYARANASIGINATSPNCVDADPRFFTRAYLIKFKALADFFRPYGIQMFMSSNFNAPMILGGMKTPFNGGTDVCSIFRNFRIYQYRKGWKSLNTI